MTTIGARRGASSSLPLMLVTFVLVGGFLFWLYTNSEPTSGPEVVEESAAVPAGPEATDADVTTLESAPQQYEGTVIRVRGVNVASPVGSQAFFVDLPRTPFLVKMGPELVAQGVAVPSGTVDVVGTLMAMNDSIISAWTADGSISEGDRPIVEFATHFIEAVAVEAGSASGENMQGGGA